MQARAKNLIQTVLRLTTVATTALALATAPSLAQTLPILGPTPPQDAMPLAEDGLAKALAALPSIAAEILNRSQVPGAAVAVVHGGQTVFSQGFGLREVGKDARIDPATVFQVASVSKSISATIAAIQVSNGVVSWDDPAVSRLPDFKLSDPYVSAHATIGDFFAHRTGLPFAAGDNLEDLGFGRKEIIARLAELPLGPFRTSYHYANFGTTIGAEAVAAASGEPWEDLAQRVLFQPLNMVSTSYRHADYLARDNRAALHAFENGRFQPLYDRDPDPQAPAGGVSSNVLDLAEWLKLLLANGQRDGRPVISPQALLPALTPQVVNAPGHTLDARSGFYGYGFNVGVTPAGRTAMSHSGAFLLGAGTNFQILPSADVGIVVLTNGAPVGAAEAIASSFMDSVQYGAPSRDWYAAFNGLMKGYFEPGGDLAGEERPTDPTPPRDLETYVGRYQNPYFGEAMVRTDGSSLQLVLGPRPTGFALAPWNGDTFVLPLSGENAPAGSQSSVSFTVQGGVATTFTVDFFNDNGMGTWRR